MFISPKNQKQLEQEDAHEEAFLSNDNLSQVRKKNFKVKLPPISNNDGFEPSMQLASQQQQSPQFEDQKIKTPFDPLVTNNVIKGFKPTLIYFHLKQFAKKLKTLIRPREGFGLKHLKLIDDKASNPKQILKTNKVTTSLLQQYVTLIQYRVQLRLKYRLLKNKLKGYFSILLNLIPMVEPVSKFKFIWDFVTSVIRLYLIITVPLIVTFFQTEVHRVLWIISCVVLMFDMLVRCFTITYEQGQPINERVQLFRRQLTWQSAVELFSFIYTVILNIDEREILDQFVIGSGAPKLLLFLLYMQISKILDQIELSQYYLKVSKAMASIIELVKLISLILLVQHVCCCIWLVVGQYFENKEEMNWMNTVDCTDLKVCYLESFYFISVTMFTVGYGDRLPTNAVEKIFTIFYMFLCTFQLSYSVNTIGTLLTQLKETHEKIRQKITTINEYMFNKKISYALQFKVREYCNFYLNQELIQQTNEQTEMIKLLPEELQHSLKMEAAQLILSKCPFFRDNLCEESKQLLLEHVDFQSFSPGIEVADKADFNVYIIESGSVDVYHRKVKISTLNKYRYFGLETFLNHQPSDLTYKTSSFTSILVIPFSQFYETIVKNQKDFELFHQYLIDGRYMKNCYICHRHVHQTQSCDLVHFTPDSEKAIKKAQMDQTQDRETRFKRKLHERFKIFEKMSYITQRAVRIQQQNEADIEKLYPDLEDEEDEPSDAKGEAEEIQDYHSPTPINSPMLMREQRDTERYHQSKPKPSIFYRLQNRQSFRQQQAMEPLCSPQISEIQQSFEFKFLNSEKFLQREQQQIVHYFKSWMKKYENIEELKVFEKLKNYEHFDPQWNIDKVTKQLKISRLEPIPVQYQRYWKYMITPWQFMGKYGDRKFQFQETPAKHGKKKKNRALAHKSGTVFPV